MRILAALALIAAFAVPTAVYAQPPVHHHHHHHHHHVHHVHHHPK